MLRPSESSTNRIARLVMRTQAVPMAASANGKTTSATPMSARPTHALPGRFLTRESASDMMFCLRSRLKSGAVADPLAQQARRPEDEYGDQHQKREHVLVVAAEKREVRI